MGMTSFQWRCLLSEIPPNSESLSIIPHLPHSNNTIVKASVTNAAVPKPLFHWPFLVTVFIPGLKGGIWTACYAIGLCIVHFVGGILSFDVYTWKEGGAPGKKRGAALHFPPLGETQLSMYN